MHRAGPGSVRGSASNAAGRASASTTESEAASMFRVASMYILKYSGRVRYSTRNESTEWSRRRSVSRMTVSYTHVLTLMSRSP
jgi:hypothetical protein